MINVYQNNKLFNTKFLVAIMEIGINRTRDEHGEGQKIYHIVDSDTGRGLIFFDSRTSRNSFWISDMPETEREYLRSLSSKGYMRKVIPSNEFEALYQKVSSAKNKKLFSKGSIWVESDEQSFDFQDMPSLDSVINGNFVDLIWENMQLVKQRKQQ